MLSKLSILTGLSVLTFSFLLSNSASMTPCDDTSLDSRFAPYQAVLDDIEACYGIKLQLAEPEQKEERYAAVFEKSVETFINKDTNIFENARFYGPSRVLAGLIYYSITTFGESLDMRRSTRDAKRKTAPRPPCGGRESFFDVCSYAATIRHPCGRDACSQAHARPFCWHGC